MEMRKKKVIFSGVTWTIVNNLVNIIYGIVSVPVLINHFGKNEYGLISLALSVNVYIQLLDMGMTNSNVRFFSEFLAKEEEGKVQKLFSLTFLIYFIIGLFNSIILFGVAFFVEDLFKLNTDQAIVLKNLLWILALNAIFSWITICFDQFLRANELIDWIKRRSSLLKVLQFGILAGTILFELSIEFYFMGYIFLSTIILPLTIFKTKNISPRLQLIFGTNKTLLKMVLPYAISIFSFSIFQFIAMNSRPIILGNISGPGTVAEFNIMNTIVLVVTIISGSFMQVLLPVVTKMAVNSDWHSIHKIIYDGTKYVSIILSILIFTLIITVKEILILYVGEEYLNLSQWLIFWLLTLLLSHRNVMTSLVFTETKLKTVSIMGAFAMFMALTCYIIYVPRFGIGGVIIGFVIHELIHTLFYYLYFIPKKFQIDTKDVFLSSVARVWTTLGGVCIILSFIPISFIDSIIFSAIFKVILMGILSIILTWFVLLNNNDRELLKSLTKVKNT